jgi:hypothetical protein
MAKSATPQTAGVIPKDERAWTDLGVGSDLEASFDGFKYVDFRSKGDHEPLMFASRGVLEEALKLIPTHVLVAARFAAQTNFFKPGDPVLYGKYKNQHGIVKRLFEDERGHPMIEIEPVPKGRKKNKEMGLYKMWHDPDPPKPEDEDGK